MHRILVTGGAGFIGSHIVEEELKRGSEVAVMDNFHTGKKENIPSGVEVFNVDIRDRDKVFQAFEMWKPTHVSHHAAQASVSVSTKKPYTDAMINIMGSLNIMDASVEYGIEHFVFASTGGAIYGEVNETSKATEEWPAKPETPYAAAKASIETYLEIYKNLYGLSYTILRYANVYGPRQDPYGEAGVVAIFCERLAKDLPVTLFARKQKGDKGCIRDYVYVKDVEAVHRKAIRKQIVGIFNVSTGAGRTTTEVLETIAAVMKKKPQIIYQNPRPGDLEVSILDNTKILSYHDTWTGFKEGIEKTARWFLKNTG